MIIGTGSDMIDIRRIEKTLKRFGERFIQRVFTEEEQRKAEQRSGHGNNSRAATYAKRFAAKEACAKALGTGMNQGVFWKDIGVVNAASGRPSIELRGGADMQLRALLPPGTQPTIHVSLTDETPYALAHVIIEAGPGPFNSP